MFNNERVEKVTRSACFHFPSVFSRRFAPCEAKIQLQTLNIYRHSGRTIIFMRISPDQLERLRMHLQSTFRGGCTVCGSPNWQFDDVIFELRQFVGGGISTEGMIKPVIPVTCSQCGHVIMINAINAGVIQVQQQPGVEAPRQESFTEVDEEEVEEDEDDGI